MSWQRQRLRRPSTPTPAGLPQRQRRHSRIASSSATSAAPASSRAAWSRSSRPGPATPQCGVGTCQCGAGSNGTPYNCIYIFSRGRPGWSRRPAPASAPAPIGGIHRRQRPDRPRRADRLDPAAAGALQRQSARAITRSATALRAVRRSQVSRGSTRSGNNAGPSFIQGTDVDVRLPRALRGSTTRSSTPPTRTTLTNLILASGSSRGPRRGRIAPLTAADLAAIANGTYRFGSQRNLLDLGIRDEHSQRDTYRVVGGLRGTFNDDWTYEVSANYGRVNEDITIARQHRHRSACCWRWMPAAIRSPARSSAARSSIRPRRSPAARRRPGADRRQCRSLAADIAACVPYNPFGAPRQPGVASPISRASSRRHARARPARRQRLHVGRHEPASSTCRAARSASRSAPNIGARMPFYQAGSVRRSDGLHQRRLDPDLRAARRSR